MKLPKTRHQWVALLRRLSLLLALGGGFYLWQRYEVLPLAESGCSPLMSLSPGTKMWIDRRPSDLGVGDVLFYELPGGSISFGRCTRVDGNKFWIETDVESCPSQASDELGWLPRKRIHARLVMAFGG